MSEYFIGYKEIYNFTANTTSHASRRISTPGERIEL